MRHNDYTPEQDAQICSHFDRGAGDLVFWSFRYFVGRMTIATTAFARELASAWMDIPIQTRQQIASELGRLFEEDDAARAAGSEHLPLGMDMDRECWELVRAAYKDETLDEENFCKYCNMQYYNCLCSHEN